MVKNKLVRNAVAVVVALGVIGTIPVFAESYDMEDDTLIIMRQVQEA